MLNFKLGVFAVILLSMAMLSPLPASATIFDTTFTVTGGTSNGVNGTPGSFAGSFDIPTFTGVGIETFTGAAQIQSFSVTFNNVWDAGSVVDKTDILTTPVNDNNFIASFTNGALTSFDFESQQFAPFDVAIDFPNGAIGGADWDLITDSDGLLALTGGFSVLARTTPPTTVPIPATLLMILVGLGLLTLIRRYYK